MQPLLIILYSLVTWVFIWQPYELAIKGQMGPMNGKKYWIGYTSMAIGLLLASFNPFLRF